MLMRRITSYLMRCVAGNRNAGGIKKSYQNRYYKEFKRIEYLPQDEIEKIGKKSLYRVISYAIENIPYYQDLGLSVSDFHEETIFEDIRRLPIMTKQIIREAGERLHTNEKIHDWEYTNMSGGTTGEPVKMFQTGKFFDYDQAAKILFDEWGGRKPGDPEIRLWGSERDIIAGKADWANKIYRWCRNEEFLNTFRMDDKQIEEFIQSINKKKPKLILAYVQSAREVAWYAIHNGIKITPPGAVMTSAGTLDDDTYKILKKAFGCDIFNRYGSRECGDMACSCKKNEGLHININNCYIEILRDDGTPCEENEIGNVTVTTLNNYAMPLIRYNIGDRASYTNRKCSCGRNWPMLNAVNGRIVDVFKLSDGNRIDGEYFTHLFYELNDVKQFQVRQDKIDHILVKLVMFDNEERNADETKKVIESGIYKAMGSDINIDFEFVDNIPILASGKRAYTICDI